MHVSDCLHDANFGTGTPPVSFGIDGNSWITSGNFGIGTSTPSADLEIAGTVGSTAIALDNGNTELRHGQDLIATNYNSLNLLVDKNDNNADDFVRIYHNTSSSLLGDPRHQLSTESGGISFFYPSWTDGGRVGIREDDPQQELHLHGEFRLESIFTWYDFEAGISSLEMYSEDGGFIGEWDEDTGIYTWMSDARSKRNISDLSGALDIIGRLNTKSYQYKSQPENAPYSFGFLAQEVKDILPGAVRYNEKNDRYTLDYSAFGVLAVQAIKEQQETIVSLEERITALEEALLKMND